jgi:hypothetical protein
MKGRPHGGSIDVRILKKMFFPGVNRFGCYSRINPSAARLAEASDQSPKEVGMLAKFYQNLMQSHIGLKLMILFKKNSKIPEDLPTISFPIII